ncbi:hypothetical protein JCM13580A_40340 [Streptomyces drozdowiczii]
MGVGRETRRHRNGDNGLRSGSRTSTVARTRHPALTRAASSAGTAVVPPPGKPGVRRSPRQPFYARGSRASPSAAQLASSAMRSAVSEPGSGV